MENNLIFLGFILFKNKLKLDTKEVINSIKISNCNLIMATGDNPFTSISVGLESGLIGINNNIYFCNLEYRISDKTKYINWYHINSTPEKNSKDKVIDNLASKLKKSITYNEGKINNNSS